MALQQKLSSSKFYCEWVTWNWWFFCQKNVLIWISSQTRNILQESCKNTHSNSTSIRSEWRTKARKCRTFRSNSKRWTQSLMKRGQLAHWGVIKQRLLHSNISIYTRIRPPIPNTSIELPTISHESELKRIKLRELAFIFDDIYPVKLNQ